MSRTAKRIILAVLIVLGLLVAAALVLPGVVGWQLEKNLEAQLGGKGLRGANGLLIQLQKFDRGWFQSQALIEIRSPQLPAPLQVDQTLVHGPLYFGQLAHGRSPLVLLASNASLRFLMNGKTEPVARVYTVLDPFMSIYSEWKLVDGILDLSGNAAWARLDYQILTGQAEVQAHIPDLKYAQRPGPFQLEDLRLRMQGRIQQQELAVGELRFSLQKASLKQGGAPMNLQDLRLLLTSKEVNERIDLNMDLSLSSMEGAEEQYGPVRLVMDMNQLPEDKLESLMARQAVISQILFTRMSLSRQQQIVDQQLLPVLLPLLSESQIHVRELLLHSGDGWIEGKLDASFKPKETVRTLLDLGMAADLRSELKFSRSWLLAAMEMQLRQRLDNQTGANSRAMQRDQRDEDAWRQAERLLENLVQQGYLKADNGVYSSAIRINDARLYMNDNEVDFISLVQ
jgi:uncharacterized protein YdgA (DUF945 family)